MHERNEELQLLRLALDAAQAGEGSALLVEGPAGIGKTTVLRAGSADAGARGITVLHVRGTELEQSHSFGGARRLLASEAGTLGDAAFAGSGRAARSVLDDGAAGNGDDPPEPNAGRLLGLLAVVGAVCDARGALMVAADDAHLLDDPTLDMLCMLCARLDELPLVLAVGARTGESDLRPALARLADEKGLRRRALAPLGPGGVAGVLRDHLGTAPSDEVVRASLEATGGNPWFVSALAEELARSPEAAADATAVRARVPRALAATVTTRVAAATEDGPAVARALLVLGDGAEPRHVAALAGVELERAVRALDALSRSGVLAPERPSRYAHAIVRAAVEREYPAGERALAHFRAAELLAADRAQPEQVAAHLLEADPAAEEWVVDSLLDAASVARARGAPERAVAVLERALAEPPPFDRRGEVLARLGTAELEAGRGGQAVRHLAAAVDEGGDDRVTTVRRLAQAEASIGRVDDAVSTLERALDGDDLPQESRIVLTADLAGLGTFGHGVANRTRHRLDALGELDESTHGGRVVLAARARNLLADGRDADLTVDIATRALARGRLAAESPVWIVWSYAVLALSAADKHGAALEELDRALESGIARGSVGWYGVVRSLRADLWLRAGDVNAALADAAGAVDAYRDNELTPLPAGVAYLVGALIERDDLDTAGQTLRRHNFDGELFEHLLFFPVLYERGRLRLHQGDAEAAARDLLELGRRQASWGVGNPCTQPWRVPAVRALLRLDRRDDAAQLAGEQMQLADQWRTARARCLGELALGLVERDRARAEQRFTAAVAEAGDEAPLERIAAQIELGRTIRQAGERERAREPLREAMNAADAAGAVRLRTEAEKELRAARGRAPRRGPEDDRLTPSELRIAELAAAGASNREIAASLFLAVRTVETHLTSAYRRLDISSRHELAGALERISGG